VAQLANWHVVFWMAAGIGAVGIVAMLVTVPRSAASARGRFDWAGAAGLAAGLVCLLLPVSEGGQWGWRSGRTLGLLAAAAGCLALWCRLELRVRDPIVDLRTTVSRPVLLANTAAFLVGFAMYAMSLILPELLQAPRATGYGSGLSLLGTGLCLAPAGLAMLVRRRPPPGCPPGGGGEHHPAGWGGRDRHRLRGRLAAAARARPGRCAGGGGGDRPGVHVLGHASAHTRGGPRIAVGGSGRTQPADPLDRSGGVQRGARQRDGGHHDHRDRARWSGDRSSTRRGADRVRHRMLRCAVRRDGADLCGEAKSIRRKNPVRSSERCAWASLATCCGALALTAMARLGLRHGSASRRAATSYPSRAPMLWPSSTYGTAHRITCSDRAAVMRSASGPMLRADGSVSRWPRPGSCTAMHSAQGGAACQSAANDACPAPAGGKQTIRSRSGPAGPASSRSQGPSWSPACRFTRS